MKQRDTFNPEHLIKIFYQLKYHNIMTLSFVIGCGIDVAALSTQ